MSESDTTPTTSAPRPDAPDTHRRRTPLAVLVIATALAGLGVAWWLDRLDTALLFVGVPCLLAYGVGMLPGRNTFGRVMQIITVILLCASALLHEGAFCMLLAAPLLYGAAAIGWWVTTRRHATQAIVWPLVILLAAEGATDTWRIAPTNQARSTAIADAPCAVAEHRLASDVELTARDLPGPLAVAPYRPPIALTGDGLDVGATWTVAMRDGQLTTRVTHRGDASARFAVADDTSHLANNVTITGGALTWRDAGGQCALDVEVTYRRKLDPALWFGPITDAFMGAGTAVFADALAAAAS